MGLVGREKNGRTKRAGAGGKQDGKDGGTGIGLLQTAELIELFTHQCLTEQSKLNRKKNGLMVTKAHGLFKNIIKVRCSNTTSTISRKTPNISSLMQFERFFFKKFQCASLGVRAN